MNHYMVTVKLVLLSAGTKMVKPEQVMQQEM